MRRIVLLAAAALLLASACATGASTPSSEGARGEPGAPPSDTATVHLPKSYTFEPETIEVAKGGSVAWVNEDDFPHTVRLLDGSGVDEQLGVGDRTSITFEDTGVVRYDCSLHPTQMKGTVVVRERPA